MLWSQSDYSVCPKCNSPVHNWRPCWNCERIEKLKGITCPCCKGTDIHLSQQSENNGIIGPGSSSWVVSENFVCNECGVLFVETTKMKEIKLNKLKQDGI